MIKLCQGLVGQVEDDVHYDVYLRLFSTDCFLIFLNAEQLILHVFSHTQYVVFSQSRSSEICLYNLLCKTKLQTNQT